jgi:acyl-CoA synthetase (AMP-forming)/AMP-acid ligase II
VPTRWSIPAELSEDWRAALLGPGAMFELVDGEVLGTSVPVFPQRPRSLGALLARTAEGHADRAFLLSDDDRLTFGEAPTRVAAIAAALAARHGVGAGDRVALAGRVSIDHLLTILATWSLGAVTAVLNPQWTDHERAQALELTKPRLLVSDASTGGAPGVETTTFADLAADAAAAGEVSADTAAVVDEDDPLAIVFTSGTTGRPKGATLSHRNAVAFALAAASAAAVNTLAHGLSKGPSGPPVVIASAPLFHVSGLLGQLVNAVAWGTTLVVPPPGRWSPEEHLRLTEAHQVTSWSIVPTQLSRILDVDGLDRYDVTSVENIGGGGATFAPELMRRTEAVFPHAAPALRIGYGATETAGSVTILQPPFTDADRHSVGPPVPGVELVIRGDDGGELAEGEVGEIWVRSAQVFLGYWEDAEATRACLDDDRWYATGDFGHVDGGLLFLESRRRDLIIRGGENIYPIEIENRLVEHPAIDDAAVVGVPDQDLGQVVKAVVVVHPGTTVTTDEVREWVGTTHARYKVPAIVEVRAELPRNDSGKVLKDQLVDPA